MSHIRIFDHPVRRTSFDGMPALAITGELPLARPSAAYEGRLAIANLGAAEAEVVAVVGDLPPGATVTVDNADDQVVVAWPAYQASAAPIPNADFEQGDAQWLKGPGWSIVQDDVNDDPTTPTSQWAARFANQGGNVELRNAVRAAVTAGQSITASCRVQQRASSATNAGAAVRLFFQPASGAEVMREGNLVDSGSNSEWGTSTLTTAAPVTGTVQIGCRGKRHRQNKPLWVDNFAWNVTQPSVGANGESTVGPITIRIRDSLGREAEWTGSIPVTSGNYVFASGASASRSARSLGGALGSWADLPTGAWSGGRVRFAGGRLFFLPATGAPYVSTNLGASAVPMVGIAPPTAISDMVYCEATGAWIFPYNGSGFISYDGLNCSPLTMPPATTYGGAAFGNTVIFGMTNGTVLYSAAGGAEGSWTSFNVFGGTIGTDVTHTGSRFLIIRNTGTGIFYSVTGAEGTWFTTTGAARAVNVLGWASDPARNLVVILFADGATRYSTDGGVNFVAGTACPITTTGSTGNPMTFANGQFYACGNTHDVYAIAHPADPAWALVYNGGDQTGFGSMTTTEEPLQA